MARRLLVFAYGIVAYLLFFGTFLYLIGFVGNLAPRSVDGPAAGSALLALAIDLGLVALFGLQHSIMARPSFKRRWTRIVPPETERSTFVLATVLALGLLMWQWRPLGGVLWRADHQGLRAVLYGAFAFGWGLVLVATFLINHFDLFGLRQVWLAFQGKPYTPVRFARPWLYRQVRHPLYLGFLIAFWAAPTMTVTHLVLATALTAYILIAIRFEERDLRAVHPEYAVYRKQVPMLVPRPGTRRAAGAGAFSSGTWGSAGEATRP
jgi:protein-S-isoprenylcysteine O-methyltransferase Ste14